MSTVPPEKSEPSPLDREYMAQALVQAHKGRFWASPNPHVGCVLVRGGVVIGAGFTQPAGNDHAEIQALKAAGDARGATAYVTLEPCAHQGRTGPCADALIAAGVARVVAAIEDPHPQVAGAGLARLRAAGIAVTTGVLAEEAEAEIQGFLLRVRRGYGRVRLKLGCSLDGRTAMASGESQWITGPAARADVQRLRAASSVIVTGSGTALADDCSLTVRSAELGLEGDELMRACHRKPLRALLDSQLRVPGTARIFDNTADTVVFAADQSGQSAKPLKTPVGERVSVEGIARTADATGLDLSAVLARLGQLGANEILIEAGPRLAAAFLRARLVDELVLYQAPKLLGSSARPLVDMAFERLADGLNLEYGEISRIGADLRIMARVIQS